MARAFYKTDDGELVESTKKKYTPTIQEDVPFNPLKAVWMTAISIICVMVWFLLLILNVFFRIIK